MGVFSKYEDKIYKHRFAGEIEVGRILGGVPRDAKVAENWLRTKLGSDNEQLIQAQVAEIMLEQKIDVEQATEIVNMNRHLNGFRRDDNGLYIEGRQLKAALKEATNIAVAAGGLKPRGWGNTNKGLLSFLAEHMFIIEDRLYLRDAKNDGKIFSEPTGVEQKFVHTWRGNGIQYEEYCENALIRFTVKTDFDFDEKTWAEIWVRGQQQGIGASRSQSFGRYEVTKWEPAPTK